MSPYYTPHLVPCHVFLLLQILLQILLHILLVYLVLYLNPYLVSKCETRLVYVAPYLTSYFPHILHRIHVLNHPLLNAPFRYYNIVRSKCSQFTRNLFEKWIPTCLRGYPILLIAFLALGIGMACAVLVSPGLKRPKSADFQVFSSSHILEQYDLTYKSKFRLEQTSDNNFNVFIFFGIKAEDNGNYLEPKNFGNLQYDNSLDVLKPEAQKWFFQDLCNEIRKQDFFGRNISWTCYPEVVNLFLFYI